MEGNSVLSFSSKTHIPLHFCGSFFSHKCSQLIVFRPKLARVADSEAKGHAFLSSVALPSPPRTVAEALEHAPASLSALKEVVKVDKSGRFCNPRAAREFALLILYASCLEGSDPVMLFDRRVNAKRYPGFVFDKETLLEYNHMSFCGEPIQVETEEEEEELLLKNEKESAIEEEVLSAPPKLVYNSFILRFTRQILEAVVDRWNQHVLIIDRVTPRNWKDEPASKILELCILHLAMAEISAVGTRHQIVINEAVDLAKRFCDGGAPRIINGCLRTFIKEHTSTEEFRSGESKS
ncbi:hypothetical protein QJS04_geneDACA013009 [Acorus gramineus]|uniref:NusB/RsmB/TIM44 domain-containing protein n=1 Tax=Acorus gramineus TaxID=55184 RepID=A0AAV9B687_ACOGR|nr:hypothetical protein QJS04_geneDACA013009 [Acorus gramineus]